MCVLTPLRVVLNSRCSISSDFGAGCRARVPGEIADRVAYSFSGLMFDSPPRLTLRSVLARPRQKNRLREPGRRAALIARSSTRKTRSSRMSSGDSLSFEGQYFNLGYVLWRSTFV